MRRLLAMGGSEILAVCDIWDERRDKAASVVPGGAKSYLDYRELLERQDIDGVVIAKPEIIRRPGVSATPDEHLKTWLECMRDRRDPNADAVSGHYSAMACHLGNLAYRRKARVEWNRKWDV